MPECPIDGCTYSNDNQGSVVAHMSSSKGDHEGIGYQKAEQMLTHSSSSTDAMDSSEPDNGPDSVSGSDGSASAQDGPDSPQAGQGSDPAMDTPDVDDDVEHEPDCPDCGGELVDYRDDGRTDVDYICSECEAGWVDQ